jgi:hypothetical protein
MIIKLTINVDKISNVISLFDVIKVYRSTTIDGTYVEITGPGTRITLVASQSTYTYDDTNGSTDYYYKTSYFNQTSSFESCQSDPIKGDANTLYITVDDIRAEGVTVVKASDDKIIELIEVWQKYIERQTRNWFLKKSMTWYMDGNGTTLLQMSVPIITVSELTINDVVISSDDYKIYNGRGETGRDDRKNPRIKIVTGDTNIFNGTGQVRSSITLFEVGEKNIKVTGEFGYVETDDSVPAPIQYALKKLVVRRCDPMVSSIGGPAGPTIEEETDRHRRKWADPISGSKAWSMTGDPEVDQILAMYKAPLMMKAPRTLYRRLTGGRW